jgi:hypothetical protein
MLGEYIQDQTGTIQKLDIITQRLFQVAQLPGREFLVKDDSITGQVFTEFYKFLDLSRSYERCRIVAIQPLPGLPYYIEPGRTGQLGQFQQRVFQSPARRLVLEFYPNE